MSTMDYAGSVSTSPRGRKARAGLGAMASVLFCWSADQRKERLAELRAREMELEIARLRAVGGC